MTEKAQQHDWKSCRLSVFCFSISVLAMVGCRDSTVTKTLPAPLSDEVTYEMEGRVGRLWSGDNFEFDEAQQMHCILIRGIDAPNEGQPLFLKSRNTLNAITRLKKLRVKVIDRDEMMKETADVFVLDETVVGGAEEVDVALKMIELGLAWYDGSQFENAETFERAQQSAKQKKLGIWAQESLAPPGEFESTQNRDEHLASDPAGSLTSEGHENELGSSKK